MPVRRKFKPLDKLSKVPGFKRLNRLRGTPKGEKLGLYERRKKDSAKEMLWINENSPGHFLVIASKKGLTVVKSEKNHFLPVFEDIAVSAAKPKRRFDGKTVFFKKSINAFSTQGKGKRDLYDVKTIGRKIPKEMKKRLEVIDKKAGWYFDPETGYYIKEKYSEREIFLGKK